MMQRSLGSTLRRVGALCAALVLAAAPALAQESTAEIEAEVSAVEEAGEDELDFEEFEEEEAAGGDPLEGMNRPIFTFNDGLDRYVMTPAARGWDYIMPDVVQKSIRHAFDNLRFPVHLLNDLLQGKFKGAGTTTARFLLNTTVGIGGFLDPATAIGLRKSDEDFGQTMGVWGIPPGPYLMIPVLGPSNVRDAFGAIVDTAARAVGFFIPFYVSAATGVADAVNRYSFRYEEIASERKAALDWYAAVRSAYSQYRENQVTDQRDADTRRRYYPPFESGGE